MFYDRLLLNADEIHHMIAARKTIGGPRQQNNAGCPVLVRPENRIRHRLVHDTGKAFFFSGRFI